MKTTDELIAAWQGTKKPNGFVADIKTKSEAEMEYGDVESYFSGLDWEEVNPEADEIRYMCPLLWMNDEAARYYSLSFLVYLASTRAIETEYNTPEMILDYFTSSELSILPKLSKDQQAITEKIIQLYDSRANT